MYKGKRFSIQIVFSPFVKNSKPSREMNSKVLLKHVNGHFG